jgi:hypothetical protein
MVNKEEVLDAAVIATAVAVAVEAMGVQMVPKALAAPIRAATAATEAAAQVAEEEDQAEVEQERVAAVAVEVEVVGALTSPAVAWVAMEAAGAKASNGTARTDPGVVVEEEDRPMFCFLLQAMEPVADSMAVAAEELATGMALAVLAPLASRALSLLRTMEPALR